MSDDTRMWQVTCQCGWRTRGTRAEVVGAVQEHGRAVHQQELSEDQVMAIAIPAGEA